MTLERERSTPASALLPTYHFAVSLAVHATWPNGERCDLFTGCIIEVGLRKQTRLQRLLPKQF